MHNFPVHKPSVENAIRKGMQSLLSGAFVFRGLRGSSTKKKDTKTNQPEPSLPCCIICKASQAQTDGLMHCSDSKAQWSDDGTGQALVELGRSLMAKPWSCSDRHHHGVVWPQSPAVQLLCSLLAREAIPLHSHPTGEHIAHTAWGPGLM